jgi:hypothetical protein
MPRGRPAEDGAKRWSPNGYHYTRVDGKWRLTHHLIMEKKLGRPINTETEMVRFIGSRRDLRPENIEIIPKNKVSERKRLATLEAQIKELTAQRDMLLEELARG